MLAHWPPPVNGDHDTHTALVWWDEALEVVEHARTLDENSPPPVKADAEGRYPVPIPGQRREI